MGQREDSRPGKPATLLELNRVGVRHRRGRIFRGTGCFLGGALDLDGAIFAHARIASAGMRWGCRRERRWSFRVDWRWSLGRSGPILSNRRRITSGIVDLAGVGAERTEPRVGERAAAGRRSRTTLRAAGEWSATTRRGRAWPSTGSAGADGDTDARQVGHGVGAALSTWRGFICPAAPSGGRDRPRRGWARDGGRRLRVRGAYGRIENHVGGAAAGCGNRRRTRKLATPASSTRAGQRLGIALAPVVGFLNLSELVLSGQALPAKFRHL